MAKLQTLNVQFFTSTSHELPAEAELAKAKRGPPGAMNCLPSDLSCAVLT